MSLFVLLPDCVLESVIKTPDGGTCISLAWWQHCQMICTSGTAVWALWGTRQQSRDIIVVDESSLIGQPCLGLQLISAWRTDVSKKKNLSTCSDLSSKSTLSLKWCSLYTTKEKDTNSTGFRWVKTVVESRFLTWFTILNVCVGVRRQEELNASAPHIRLH